MNALLTSSAVGGFALVGLLILCFVLVHILRLAEIGWKHKNERPTPPPQQPEKNPELPPRAEPIYYIVEKKRKPRPKAHYSEPKEIKFK